MTSKLPNLEYLKFIEPHLALKIVEFLLKQNSTEELKTIYKNLSIATKNYDNIKNEKMLSETELNEFEEKNNKEMAELEEKLKAFLNLSENCETQKTHDLNLFSLGKKIIEETSTTEILQYATKLFDLKKYDKAASLLNSFSIFHENSRKNKSKAIYALYLLFSIKILTEAPAEKIEENFLKIKMSIEKLKEILDETFTKTDFDSVDNTQVDFKEVLLYRGYLVHWALFIIKYNSTLFLDVLFEDKYYNFIETSFNYLFKYLIVFAIINNSRKYIQKIKDSILKKINFIKANSKGPFITLLENIFINYNSQETTKLLEDCKETMKKDYFLYEFVEQFDTKVKNLILENYLLLNEDIEIEDCKLLFNENIDETKKNVKNLIEYFYPGAKIKEENDKISYVVEEDEINNYYKIKTNDLYALTKNMVEFFKENKNN